MNKSKSLIFFGNERLSSGFVPNGAPTLQALLDAGYDIAAVVANFAPATSRKARRLEVAEVAERYKIPVLLPKKMADIHDQLLSYQAAGGVLVAYGKIIPQSIIDLFPCGILNIHPSLLPQYRGSTPIEQAILDGAPQTGVSIMGLSKAMDAGPIFAQQAIKLIGNETKQALTQGLLNLGGQLLLDILPSVLDGSAATTPQDETKATYTPQIHKADGIIDWQQPAVHIERAVRAYAQWPKSRAKVLGHDVIATKTRLAADRSDGALVIRCNPGWLEVLELIGPSGKTMRGADFVRGYQR